MANFELSLNLNLNARNHFTHKPYIKPNKHLYNSSRTFIRLAEPPKALPTSFTINSELQRQGVEPLPFRPLRGSRPRQRVVTVADTKGCSGGGGSC